MRNILIILSIFLFSLTIYSCSSSSDGGSSTTSTATEDDTTTTTTTLVTIPVSVAFGNAQFGNVKFQ